MSIEKRKSMDFKCPSKSDVLQCDDVPQMELGERRRVLDGWRSRPVEAAHCQGPL